MFGCIRGTEKKLMEMILLLVVTKTKQVLQMDVILLKHPVVRNSAREASGSVLVTALK